MHTCITPRQTVSRERLVTQNILGEISKPVLIFNHMNWIWAPISQLHLGHFTISRRLWLVKIWKWWHSLVFLSSQSQTSHEAGRGELILQWRENGECCVEFETSLALMRANLARRWSRVGVCRAHGSSLVYVGSGKLLPIINLGIREDFSQ